MSGLHALATGGFAVSVGLSLGWIGSQTRGPLSMALTPSWVPTTLPFLLVAGGCAFAAAGLCAAWRNPPRALAGLGRQSLSVYVGHLVLLIVPLRWVWPDEDWSVGVGMEAWFWWTAASGVWAWWCIARGNARGPLETVLGWISGKRQ